MELTLIRHGESEANVTGHWQGQGDSPLSPRGREQAGRLADRLRHAPFDRLIASDLSRAQDTAKALGRPFNTIPTWREVDVGGWEGLTRAEVAERFPEEIARLKAGATDIAIGGSGESWDRLRERAQGALESLLGAHRGEAVVVVSHGGVISTLVASLLGLPYRPPRPLGRLGNTSVSSVAFGESDVRLRRYNDQAHLQPCSQWAEEQRQAGKPVLTFVAVRREVFGAEGGGRGRGNTRLTELEQLAGRYGRLDAVGWHGSGSAHKAAAVLAQRRSSAADVLPETTHLDWSHLDQLAKKHATGKRVAFVAEADSLRGLFARLLGLAPEQLEPPGHGTVSHVVLDGPNRTLADYGLGGW